MAVRFLHAADLHLGSPLELESSEGTDAAFDGACRGALERIIDTAIAYEVAFLVVSGDLYDQQARSVEANEFLISQFERLESEDIPCYVIHGNHDPLYDGAERLEWPEHVHVFSAEGVGQVEYTDGERPVARLLGQSYGQQWESNSLYWHYTPEDQVIPNIGLLHTGLNPDGNRYAPSSPSKLAEKDIDYWALGHIHTPGEVDGAPAAYPGIPQGRHADEVAVGGCYVVELGPGGDPDLTFVPTSPVAWQEVTVDLSEAATEDGKNVGTLSELKAVIAEEIQEFRNRGYAELASESFESGFADVEWEPEGLVVRVSLSGRSELHEQLDSEATDWLVEQVHDHLPAGSPAIHVESVRDRTSPPLPDVETLREEDETIDELHKLVGELRSDEETREELREVVGELWEWTTPEKQEDVSPKRLALDDERLDELIERALRQATDTLAMERYNVD